MDMYNICILYRNPAQLRILYVYYMYNTRIKKTRFPDAISRWFFSFGALTICVDILSPIFRICKLVSPYLMSSVLNQNYLIFIKGVPKK